MEIRLARQDDLGEVERVFERARRFMREAGNPTQWGNSYPERELLVQDMERGHLHVVLDGGRVCGVFAFALGEDPTYRVIEDGAWLDDEPYGTIHRVASDGTAHGIFPLALDFCRAIEGNIRIDTHADNAPMLHSIEKAGFVRCGTIYHTDGTPRVAFQMPAELRVAASCEAGARAGASSGGEGDWSALDGTFDEVAGRFASDVMWVRFFGVRPCCPAPGATAAREHIAELQARIEALGSFSDKQRAELADIAHDRLDWYVKTFASNRP